MDGSDEASSIGDTEDESGEAASEDGSGVDIEEERRGSSVDSGTQQRGNKRQKLPEKEDRISSLPDSLIHHILSYLPSTKEAIQTGILSKRWRNQWTHLPLLIFENSGMFSDEDFATSIDNTLLHHDCCSKVKKFHLAYDFEKDTNFSSKICFAARKHVEELILDHNLPDTFDSYHLPECLLNNGSLVKLELINCCFPPNWSINWGSLKALKIDGYAETELVANVLAGCPSLESLELNPHGPVYYYDDYVVASISLKTLILVEVDIDSDSEWDIKISCPNLEEFSVKAPDTDEVTWPDNTIQNVVSGCPLLRSLELKNCYFNKLVIASISLKKLVLGGLNEDCEIEISCPNLEELDWYGFIKTFESMTFPSLIRATLDFEIGPSKGCENLAKEILEQLQHVKELTVGRWFIKILADVEMGGRYYRWLNNKTLTLNGPKFKHLPGIVCALRSSPALERLVIKLQVYKCRMPADPLDLDDLGENYLNSNGIASNCLVSHLKTATILGLSKRDAKCELVLDFIEFLLKNARVLEKLVVVISKDRGRGFAFKVSQKVLSFPRCSQQAIVELFYSE